MSGFYAYKELFDEYHIQLELAETHLILAVLTIGTRQEDIDALIEALKRMSAYYTKDHLKPLKQKIKYTEPLSYARPRDAYHAKKYVKMKLAENEIAAESSDDLPTLVLTGIVIPGEVNYQTNT